MADSRKPSRGVRAASPPAATPPPPPPRRAPPSEESLSGSIPLLDEEMLSSDALSLDPGSKPHELSAASIEEVIIEDTPPPPPRPRSITPPPPIRPRLPTPMSTPTTVAAPPVAVPPPPARTRIPTPMSEPISLAPSLAPSLAIEDSTRPRRLTPPPPPPGRSRVEAAPQAPMSDPMKSPPAGVPHRIGIDPTIQHARKPKPTPGPLPPVRPATSLFHANVVEDEVRSVRPAPVEPPRRPVESVWDGEIAMLRREITALREREPARAALLLGGQAAILLGTRGDRAGAKAALDDAILLAEERWSLYLLRREALAERAFPRALELARRELERVADPRERLALLIQIATLEEVVGADRAAAKKALEAARELDPRSVAPLLALLEIYLDDKAWEPLAASYHALADTSSDPALRGMFRHAAGVIEERGLGKDTTARDTYRAALVEDPANLPAVVSLSSLALRTEDWGELARSLEFEADRLEDAAVQRRLYERAGDLYWERLSDADGASTAYRKAALAAPDAPGPLRRLAAVLESIGRWNELVDVLVAELPLCRTPEERAELHHLLGEVKENHLERPDDALASYEAALVEVPDHTASLQALTGLFARTRRLDALMRAELGEAERITDAPRRAARYLHLGDLAMHVIGDETEAARLYERCAELERGHRAAFQGLEAIHRRRGDNAALAATYERQAEGTQAKALKRFYLLSAARSLLDADRQDEGRALAPSFLQRVEAHLRAAQAIVSDDITPLYTLADALEDAGQWEPLVDALAKLSEKLEEPQDQIGLLHRTARVLELRLGADARALTTYEEILKRSPAHEAALLAVVRLHQRAGRGAEEIEALGRLRDRAASSASGVNEGAALSYRVGRIYERRIGDTEAAVRAYEEALARRADFAPALRALERLLRRDRRWPRLVEILERQLGSARAPIERAELRYTIGQIEELHRRDLERAEESYTLALKEVPGHEPASAALAHVREAKKDPVGLARLLDDQRARVHDPSALVALLCRLGHLAEGPLEDPARAAQLYAQAIDTSPLGARLQASLIRAARRHGGFAASTVQLRAFGHQTTDVRLQLGARLLVALREELTGTDHGTRAFEDAGAIAPRDPVVLDGRIRRMLAGAGPAGTAEPRIAELLSERARTVDSASLRALLYLEAACRYDRAGHAHDSATALAAADQAANDFLPVLRGVRRIAVGSEQWVSAVALYAHEAELVRDPENQGEALVQAGELSLGKANDARHALEHFRRLLSLQPLHEHAFERTAQILERAKDWLAIAALYRHRAEAAPDPANKAEAWRKKAEIERDRLRDVPSALASLRAALEAAPDSLDAWKAIAPLQEHQRFWQDAIETYHRIAELSRGDALARAAKIREADLRERELGDRDGARQILSELVVDPSDRDAARRMAALCERMGRWEEAQTMWTQLASTRDPKERADALFSLGQVLERGARDPEAALGCYEEALQLAVADPAIAEQLEALFRNARILPVYAEAAERALERPASNPTERRDRGQLELRVSLARIYLEDLRRPDLAEHQLTACTELSPDDAAGFRRLGELLVATGRPERALPLLHRALDLEPSSAQTLRALGEGLGYTGLKDAPRLFETAAAHIDGSEPPPPSPPLAVRRALGPDEWGMYFPRESGPGKVALSELARTVDAYSAQLIGELTGEHPTGEPLEPGKADSLVRATFHALGVAPLRVYVDTELGDQVMLCADERVALNIGASLLEPARGGRLIFEIARICGWIAQGETLGAALHGRQLGSFIQAACDEGGDDEVREVRRRVGKALPRKLRKELERFAVPLADAHGVATAWARSGYAAVDELALLVCRDVGVVFEALGYRPGEPLPSRGRGLEMIQFLASEDCWRAYRRLVDG